MGGPHLGGLAEHGVRFSRPRRPLRGRLRRSDHRWTAGSHVELAQHRTEINFALGSQLEESFQVDRGAEPKPLELPLALAQVAGVA